MPYVERRNLRKGRYAYRISAYHKGTRYRMNFRPEAGLTERQADKAAEQAAIEFEEKIKRGVGCHFDGSVSMSDWIDYVVQQKAMTGRKRKTISDYRYMSIRLKKYFGDRSLCDICPADIVQFTAWLGREESAAGGRAIIREDVNLLDILNMCHLSRSALARDAGLSATTVSNAVSRCWIAEDSAKKISTALSYELEDLFEMQRSSRALSQETQQDYHRFLSLVFSTARRQRVIESNPIEQLDKPLVQEKREPESLQPEEIQRIQEAVGQEPLSKQCLIHLLMITGCRRGEIAGLRWSQVDWAHSLVKINLTIQYTPQDGTYEETTKTRQTRKIRIPTETLELLKNYRQCQSEKFGRQCEYVFTNKDGQSINPESISGYMSRFRKKYKLTRLCAHMFRHSMASLLYHAGQDPVSISKRLGHANVSTTQNIYAHLIQQADTESAEMIADAILRPSNASSR